MNFLYYKQQFTVFLFSYPKFETVDRSYTCNFK